MNRTVNLYIVVKSFLNSCEITGEITFKSGIIIPYQAKLNRHLVTEFKLLNEEKMDMNDHMPENLLRQIKSGVLSSLRRYLEKKNYPLEKNPPNAVEGTITEKMYKDSDKIIGTKMCTFEMEESEFEKMFTIKLLPAMAN